MNSLEVLSILFLGAGLSAVLIGVGVYLGRKSDSNPLEKH